MFALGVGRPAVGTLRAARFDVRFDARIDLVFLLVGSPHLNPIEHIWKSLKWEQVD